MQELGATEHRIFDLLAKHANAQVELERYRSRVRAENPGLRTPNYKRDSIGENRGATEEERAKVYAGLQKEAARRAAKREAENSLWQTVWERQQKLAEEGRLPFGGTIPWSHLTEHSQKKVPVPGKILNLGWLEAKDSDESTGGATPDPSEEESLYSIYQEEKDRIERATRLKKQNGRSNKVCTGCEGCRPS